MWSDSVAPVLMAYSSASALLRASVACVRLRTWIVDPMNLMTKPGVDFLVAAHPALSETTKTSRSGVVYPLLGQLVARTTCSAVFL